MPGPIDYSKITIYPNPDTAEWWAGTKEGKLLVRECNSCGYMFFPPYPMCARCNSMNLGWRQSAGAGIIYSYCVIVQPVAAAFLNAVPFVVGLVELDDCRSPDGSLIRIPFAMLDDEDAVAIGLPAKVVFEPSNDPDLVFPRWKISGGSPNQWRFSG
jgi:uncharacterized protein